jgi:60 kDa SS-A/Ro ribonucleoprotein
MIRIMEANNSGGFSFHVDDWSQFCRFVILGSESSCYVPGTSLKDMACGAITRLMDAGRGGDMIQYICKVSDEGRAPKQSYGLYALAKIAEYSDAYRHIIFRHFLVKICRTFSTLAEFLSYMPNLSWGSNTRRCISEWIFAHSPHDLAYQFTKYKNRGGYTPKDILRLVHPSPQEVEYNEVFAYVTDKWNVHTFSSLHGYLQAAHELRYTSNEDHARTYIRDYRFGWEHVGNQKLLKCPAIWEQFIENGMPYHAMLRNLSRMCKLSIDTNRLASSIGSEAAIKASRVHPLQILQAMKMVDDEVLKASLQSAFHVAFANVMPSSKRFLVALDVSGSMGHSMCCGMRTLTAREAACAIALTMVKREPYVKTMCFQDKFVPFNIQENDDLDKVIKRCAAMQFGTTDCSLPIQYALDNKWEVDVFVVITDSETNCNSVPPHKLLQTYRDEVNPNAKLIVLATSATSVSIADPMDRGMLDVAGLDASILQVIREFSLGTI